MADITPVTREEFYLAKAGGQDVPVPSAVTREEYYLEKLSNDSVVVPSPVTRREKFLHFACGGKIDLPSEGRMTRLERLIAKAGGMDVSTPTAVTRLEKFWANVEGSWKIAELTGVLPLTFRSNGTALVNYRIYGTADGTGVQTESGEPAGYKLPLAITSGTESKDTDVYIGDSKLGAEEYVDYEEQKVYRRGENLTDWNKTFRYGVNVNLNQDSATVTTTSGATLYPCLQFSANASGGPDSLGLVPGKKYIVTYTISNVSIPASDTGAKYFCLRDSTNRVISSDENRLNVEGEHIFMFTFQEGTYLSILLSRTNSAYVSSLTMSKLRITELTPTDPPLPLPELETFEGANTLDSTETLGGVTITGKIKEAE